MSTIVSKMLTFYLVQSYFTPPSLMFSCEIYAFLKQLYKPVSIYLCIDHVLLRLDNLLAIHEPLSYQQINRILSTQVLLAKN